MSQPEISHLLPHGPALQLLDDILAYDESVLKARSGQHRNPVNPLRSTRGVLGISSGIEFAGQAMAIHAALTMRSGSSHPRQGLLVMAKDLTWIRSRLDDVIEDLDITVNLITANQTNAMYHFHIETSRLQLMSGRLAVMYGEPTR